MHREGYGIVFAFLLTALVMSLGAWILVGGVMLHGFAVLSWLLTLFSIYFFRDPDRKVPDASGAIISPADGKIIEIGETDEPEYVHGRAIKVSIFMSVVDVHVNRAPTDGVVRYFRYQKGRFVRAYLDEASIENEQAIIGIEDNGRKILFKQIAGLIARRVCCDLREGHKVTRGERIGIIKFGSRVDIFMPLDVKLRVALHQRVRAGESILGVY